MDFFEFCKDLVDTARERIKTPILSTYFFSFVLYNWKFFVYMFYSNDIIEKKIENSSLIYLDECSFFIPLLYLAFYLFAIPHLSYWLTKILYQVGKDRKAEKNKEKNDALQNKIELADKEIELQDKLSRNKEKQELLDKIESMEKQRDIDLKSAIAVNESYQSQINDLINQLDQSNEIIDSKTSRNERAFNRPQFSDILGNSLLTNIDIQKLLTIPTGKNVVINKYLSDVTEKFLTDNKMAIENHNSFLLNPFGIDFIEYLNDLSSSGVSIESLFKSMYKHPGY